MIDCEGFVDVDWCVFIVLVELYVSYRGFGGFLLIKVELVVVDYRIIFCY